MRHFKMMRHPYHFEATVQIGPLQQLTMQKKWIYEVIVSTFCDGVAHATPVGIWTNDFSTVHMEIFKGSTTLQNITQGEHFAVNFAPSVQLFHAALFQKVSLSYKVAQKINAPVLSGCPAIAEVKLNSLEDLHNKVRIEGRVVNLQMDSNVKLINRAESIVLESLILATRLSFAPESETTLRENFRVVCKVAPESIYQETMEKLLKGLQITR